MGRTVLARHRRLTIGALIIGLVLGLAAGKAWASLESGPDPVATSSDPRAEASTQASALGASERLAAALQEEQAILAALQARADALAAAIARQGRWDALVALAWDIGACEEPDRLPGTSTIVDLLWGTDGYSSDGRFVTAFGIGFGFWAQVAAPDLPAYAPNATPAQQVVGFGRAWTVNGGQGGGWSCKQAGRTAPDGWRELRGLLEPPPEYA